MAWKEKSNKFIACPNEQLLDEVPCVYGETASECLANLKSNWPYLSDAYGKNWYLYELVNKVSF